MHESTTTLITLALAVACGAMNVFNPDRWLPTSVLAWQKGWRMSRTIAFSALILFTHVLAGYFLFLFFQTLGQKTGKTLGFNLEPSFFLAALAIMVALSFARRVRFPRIQELFRSSKGVWGGFVVFSLLGPCEMVIPIFVKSKSLGVGYLTPFLAFLAGTWIAGTLLVVLGRRFWNRPLALPRSLDWAYRRGLVLAVLNSLILVVGFSLI